MCPDASLASRGQAVFGRLSLLGKVLTISAFVGFLGLVVHGAYVTTNGPIKTIDQATPAYMAAFFMFLCFQVVYGEVQLKTEFCRNPFLHRLTNHIRIAYYATLGLLMFGCCVCYSVFKVAAPAVWSALCVFVCILAIAELVRSLNGSQLWPHSSKRLMSVQNTSTNPASHLSAPTYTGGPASAPSTPPNETTTSSTSGGMSASLIHGNAAAAEPKHCCDCSHCSKLCCFHVYNRVNKIIMLLFAVGALASAALQAHGVVAYGPRGTFVMVDAHSEEGGTQPLKLLYLCEGPRNSSFPTFVMEADASHGSADFWPLQAALTAAGRRSCVYDKPGLGYSERYWQAQDVDAMVFYTPFMEHLASEGETSPFIFIAWGGGNEIVYRWALRQPSMVAGLVYIDGYAPAVEWRVKAHLEGWTGTKQLNDFARGDLAGRFVLFAGLRGFAVPLGLAPVLVPGNASQYALPERYDEYRNQYAWPKTWTVQYFSLAKIAANESSWSTRGVFELPAPAALLGTPTLAVVSNRTDSATCKDARTDKECEDAVESRDFLLQDALYVANRTGNMKVEQCVEDDCSLSMTTEKPDFIVRAIMREWPL